MLRIVWVAVLLIFFEPSFSFSDTWVLKKHKGKWGSREYRVFIPVSIKPFPSLSPLVVMLHGCLQTAEEFAYGTEMNNVARREGFTVIYPEQPRTKNLMRCWNWFEPINQKRASGEAGLLVGLIEDFLSQNPNLDRNRVYIAGLSAGGAMASILSICYPEVFAGAAIHSGVGYKFGVGAHEAGLAMRKGAQHDLRGISKLAWDCAPERKQVTPTIILHGKADDVASPINADQILQQLFWMGGLGGKNSPSRKILIEGLGHAWSGGNEKFKFNSKYPPKSSELIWQFFTITGTPRGKELLKRRSAPKKKCERQGKNEIPFQA